MELVAEDIGAIYNSLRKPIDHQIELLVKMLGEIELWLELTRFDGKNVISRNFVENEFNEWLNYYCSDDLNKYVEECLAKLPFETAYRFKNPDYSDKSNTDVLREVFGDGEHEWRETPSSVRNASIQYKLRIIKRFEYMCYYVINTRDELLFDIRDFIDNAIPAHKTIA